MARGSPQVFTKLGRGLNTKASPYELEAGETPECLNVRGTDRDAVRKRDGMIDLTDGNLATQPRKLAVITRLVSGEQRSYVLALGAQLQPMALDGANAGVPGTPTTGAATSHWAWAIEKPIDNEGPLFFQGGGLHRASDGVTVVPWTARAGSTVDGRVRGPIPTGRVMASHMNRLYVADLSLPEVRPAAVMWTEAGDARSWPTVQMVEFEPAPQRPITGLCSLGQSLLVFKRDGIWRIYDDATGANQKITDETGTVWRDSIVATDQGCLFVDPDQGLMVCNGQSAKLLSDKILPTLRAIPLGRDLEIEVSAAFWQGSYWLSVPDGTGVPYRLYEYNVREKAWWVHDCAPHSLAVATFGTAVDAPFQRDALIGAPPASRINAAGLTSSATAYRVVQLLRHNTPYDRINGEDGQPVQFSWRSAPHLVDGNPHIRKRLSMLRVDSTGTGQASQLRDFETKVEHLGDLDGSGQGEGGGWGEFRPGNWGEVRGPFAWGGAKPMSQSSFYTLGTARAWQLQVQGATAGKFELASYALFVGPRGRRD